MKIALSVAQMARMSQLLDEALSLDAAGRGRWLAQLPEEHRDLAPALERALLKTADAGGDSPLDTLPRIGAGRTQPSAQLAAGQRIGPYQLARRVGAGGMAEVWLAQRADGAYQRGVALKLPRLSIHRQDLALRFANERDILAGLEHMHIARLYDAGISEEGLPYLAMEFVPGDPLTAWCDKRRLGIPERIELFLQVLDAVDYAHSRQVIHCDIKPSNVLVTEAGQVRLLDFGVAKLLADDGDTQTQLSNIFGRALTPDYASPEHLRGDPVDALSDIYSLGVLLHELLCGSRPSRLELLRSAQGPARTAIKAQVQPPSDRLAPGAEQARASTRTRLSRLLRGDLDAITLKALALAPQDRYGTAQAFADDLKRHLRREPVHARRGRLLYRAERFFMRHRGHTASAVGAALLVLVAGGVAVRSPPSPASMDKSVDTIPIGDKSIAVLPFVDMSEGKDQEYFSDGLSEELLNLLSKVPGLHVAARTSAFSFKGKTDDIPTIARKLRVANILEGSVRKSGDRLRISAQLVRADNGYQLWSQTYDRKIDDIFKIQGEIASSVAQALKASLLAGASLMPSGTQSTDAYTSYLQARSLIQRGGDRDDWDRIAVVLQRVLALEPTFAPAWAWYSHARSEQAMRGYLPASQGYEEGRQAARKALALDPKLPEAHAAMAKVQMLYDWDWERAQAQIRESLELDPGNWTALQWSGILAEELGNFDDAAEQLTKASAIDPLSSYSIARLARTYYKAGKLPQAQIAYVRAVALKAPSDHYIPSMGGLLFLEMGELHKALAIFDGASEEATRLSGRSLACFALGMRAEADIAFAQFKTKYAAALPYQVAAIYAYRGESDSAFAWLDRAYRQRDFALADVKGDPVFRKLWPDRRFQEFLHRMNFPG